MIKNRTFKSKIVISYILIILIVGTLFSVTNYILTLQTFIKLRKDAINSANKRTVFNKDLQYESLKLLDEYFVIKTTRNVANQLSFLIDNNEFENFLHTDGGKHFQNLAQNIVSKEEKEIGRINIINNKGIITFDSDEKFIGQNYKVLQRDYPYFYKTIKEFLQKPEGSGYFIGGNDDERSNSQNLKFFASKYILKSSITLFYVLDVPFIIVDKLHSELAKRERTELDQQIQKINKISINIFIKLGASFFVILVLSIILTAIIGSKFAKKIAQPIVGFKDAVKKIGKGEFNIHVNDHTGTRETAELAETFNTLCTDLAGYIAKLKKEIAARTAMENEIKVAKKVQKSLVPRVTKEFNNDYFSLYSKLFPAKEVSGDFYDFFFHGADKNTLVFLVADVSGKGIPAALFMGIAKTIIKNISLLCETIDPGEVLAQANSVLCQDNDEFMFVTAFLACYKLDTGDLSYANAGHHQAIRINKGNCFEKFGNMNSSALGFELGQKYTNGSIKVNIGEKVILYTDGITDALLKDKVYGQERFDKILIDNSELSSESLCKLILEDVKSFQKGKLFDDITMLVFARKS